MHLMDTVLSEISRSQKGKILFDSICKRYLIITYIIILLTLKSPLETTTLLYLVQYREPEANRLIKQLVYDGTFQSLPPDSETQPSKMGVRCFRFTR